MGQERKEIIEKIEERRVSRVEKKGEERREKRDEIVEWR